MHGTATQFRQMDSNWPKLMSQVVLCPQCQSQLAIGEKHAGRRVRCPHCKKPFLAPARLKSVPQAAPPPIQPFGGTSTSDPKVDDPWTELDGYQEKDWLTSQSDRPTFRFRCPACESILYVTLDQANCQVRCEDCLTVVRVPQAPPHLVNDQFAVPNRQPETLAQEFPVPVRDFADRLEERMREDAERVRIESEKAKRSTGLIGWFRMVFGILIDPGVLLHMITLMICMSLPVALTVFQPFYAFGTVPFIGIAFTVLISCGLGIINSVANGFDHVDDWPTIDLFSWLESTFIVGAALVCAITPSLFMATILHSDTLTRVTLMLAGAHLLFPFVILSMLDMQTVLAPISVDVAKGYRDCSGECMTFYVAAAALIAIGPFYFANAPYGPVYAGIGTAIAVLIAFFYFAMVGRLGYALGHFAKEVPGGR